MWRGRGTVRSSCYFNAVPGDPLFVADGTGGNAQRIFISHNGSRIDTATCVTSPRLTTTRCRREIRRSGCSTSRPARGRLEFLIRRATR